MAIEFQNAPTAPALVYNKIFLTNLKIEQKPNELDDLPPRYSLFLEWRLYAVDNEGRRHYKNKVDTVQIEDYYSLAIQKAATGDNDLAIAMQAIEIAVGNVLEDQTGIEGVKVVS